MTISSWIWQKIKASLLKFVPLHINDPFGLIKRMLASRNSAALFTLVLTGLGIVMIPVDKVLGFFERRCDTGEPGNGPHIIICGPARSGTTLVYQLLADELPVNYIRNFTALFPQSPILTSTLFSRSDNSKSKVEYKNYYGKTAGFQEPNEANHLWNQWVDADQSGFRTILSDSGGKSMAKFFRQFSGIHNSPTLSKNNNVNAFAEDVNMHLDNCWFICLKRDTRYLAQSLLTARTEINGNINQNYGVSEDDYTLQEGDPVENVLAQIQYLDELAIKQQVALGKNRFWIVDYEWFCSNPQVLVDQVRKLILNIEAIATISHDSGPIKNNNKVTDPALFKEIVSALEEQIAA